MIETLLFPIKILIHQGKNKTKTKQKTPNKQNINVAYGFFFLILVTAVSNLMWRLFNSND